MNLDVRFLPQLGKFEVMISLRKCGSSGAGGRVCMHSTPGCRPWGARGGSSSRRQGSLGAVISVGHDRGRPRWPGLRALVLVLRGRARRGAGSARHRAARPGAGPGQVRAPPFPSLAGLRVRARPGCRGVLTEPRTRPQLLYFTSVAKPSFSWGAEGRAGLLGPPHC